MQLHFLHGVILSLIIAVELYNTKGDAQMKKLAVISLLMAFVGMCMTEMHGLGYAVPTLVFAGLALVFTYLMDKPRKEKKQEVESVEKKEEAA